MAQTTGFEVTRMAPAIEDQLQQLVLKLIFKDDTRSANRCKSQAWLQPLSRNTRPASTDITNRRRLPGHMCVGLDRHTLNTRVAQEQYAICEKSDGERRMFLTIKRPE